MTARRPDLRPPPFRALPGPVLWLLLLVLSIPFALALELLRLPAALLLGPMAAGILFAVAGADMHVPSPPMIAAQGVIGCMIARSVTTPILGEIVADAPIFLAGVVSVIAASTVLGWLAARRRILPGTTAVWGASPGAATVMVVMSEAYGADPRLVALMQYLRVVLVAITASAVAALMSGEGGAAAPATAWFPTVAWDALAETVAVIAIGAVLGTRLRIPAGALLVPLILAVALQAAGVLTIELPPWLLGLSYAAIGWGVGLRFTRPILVYAGRAFPRILFSILTLIAVCGVFATLLTLVTDVAPLTAYLATSPGGVDSAAIIAASSDVDLPFVMAMQTTRFAIVLLVGPWLARLVARRALLDGA
jgi:membrane AbrB-like protein